MSVVADYRVQAELSLTAYSSLYEGISGNAYRIALEGDGTALSPKHAEDFAATWRVIDQYTHSEVWTLTDEVGNETTITGTNGLSVTLFEAVVGGKRYVAVRGTDDLNDIWTDITDVALLGTPERQVQYADLKRQLSEWLADPLKLQGRTFSVTGHSLGGFLAGALLVDFPMQIEHAYLFNAPGVGGARANLPDGLKKLLGLPEAPSLDLSKVSNLVADAGISPIAGLGMSWGVPIPVAIENQFLSDVSSPPAARNHSQQVVTDSLALYALYGQLFHSLTLNAISDIVKASSDANAKSLESALDALRALLVDGDIATNPGKQTPTGDRDAFYRNLYAVQSNPNFKSLQTATQEGRAGIATLIRQGSGSLMSLAEADFGAFLALNFLLPIALTGADGTLSVVHEPLYAAWQADHSLTPGQRIGGAAHYSDAWYADRANMLTWVIQWNLANGRPEQATQVKEPWVFIDQTSAKRYELTPNGGTFTRFNQVVFGTGDGNSITGDILTDHLYGGAGNDTLAGAAGHDYIEGNAGADSLDGGTGNDRLLGGVDDDILIGGRDADWLYGGKGLDRYRFTAGDGLDVIDDFDGNGLINIDGTVLAGGKPAGPNLWLSPDKSVRYALADQGDGTRTLNILYGGDRLFARGEVDFSAAVVAGDTQAPSPGKGDFLDGGDGSDTLVGDAGPDALLGGVGGDLISGGGDDFLAGDGQAAGVGRSWAATRTVEGDRYTWTAVGFSVTSTGGGNDIPLAAVIQFADVPTGRMVEPSANDNTARSATRHRSMAAAFTVPNSWATGLGRRPHGRTHRSALIRLPRSHAIQLFRRYDRHNRGRMEQKTTLHTCRTL